MSSGVIITLRVLCSFFRERQQQLDELSKELQRVQDEAEMLKMKLKAMSRNSNSGASGASVSSTLEHPQIIPFPIIALFSMTSLT